MTHGNNGPEDQLTPVEYICITPDHLDAGRDVPDGEGTLTVNRHRWAYCSAGLKDAPHDWKETGGVSFEAIRHADLPFALPNS